jgi:transcriptional regulator with XRE-family HTH domain
MKLDIRSARVKRGISRTQLSEAIGVSTAYIGMVEYGTRRIHADRLPKIAKALDCSINDLFAEEDAPNEHH